MFSPILLAVIVLGLVFCGVAEGEDDAAVERILKETQQRVEYRASQNETYEYSDYRRDQMQKNFIYIIILAIMSISSLCIVLLAARKSGLEPRDYLLISGLNFIVFGTIIATLAVPTTEQLAAVTGILGAIGGYLFGTSRFRRSARTEDNSKGKPGSN